MCLIASVRSIDHRPIMVAPVKRVCFGYPVRSWSCCGVSRSGWAYGSKQSMALTALGDIGGKLLRGFVQWLVVFFCDMVIFLSVLRLFSAFFLLRPLYLAGQGAFFYAWYCPVYFFFGFRFSASSLSCRFMSLMLRLMAAD